MIARVSGTKIASHSRIRILLSRFCKFLRHCSPGFYRALNQTTGDLYTYATVSILSSARHAHGKRRAAEQTCAHRIFHTPSRYCGGRTLRRLGTNGVWFDLDSYQVTHGPP